MKTRYRVFNLILALFLFIFAIGYVFAWFSDRSEDLPLSGASAGAYFKGGSGKENDPYTLGNYKHFYNLAWLQNTDRIPDGTYFALDPDDTVNKTIEMIDENGKSVVLPPIGNDENPFNSTFDGRGCTIKDLVVSTNKNVLYGDPAVDSYKFSNAVGMFGMTGATSNISNFILDNPTIEVSNESSGNVKTQYNDASTKAAGLAIGYVANKASSIGVKGGALAVHRENYSTVNSILGAIDESALNDQNITGGGSLGTGGSGSSFGASFDVKSLLDRLKKINIGKYGKEYDKNSNPTTPQSGASIFLPEIDDANSDPTVGANDKVPFTVVPEQSTYEGSSAREVIASNNVGYVIGNQNKTQVKSINFAQKLIFPENKTPSNDPNLNWTLPDRSLPNNSDHTPQWLYTNDNEITTGGDAVYTPASGFRPLTDEEYNALPQNIKDLISGDDTSFETLRLQSAYWVANDTTTVKQYENDGQWQYFGQIEWNGNVYYNGFKDNNGYAVDSRGQKLKDTDGQYKPYQYYTGGVYLKKNCIWFKPTQLGKIRLVLYAGLNSGDNTFQLVKVTRANATSDNPFYIKEYSDISMQVIMAHNIVSKFCLMYYEYQLTEDDLKPGVEFFLCGFNDNGGANFIYMDIGSSEAETKPDTGQADSEKAITSIDFIYDGVTINQKDDVESITKGSFVIVKDNTASIYAETGVMISFSGSGALVYYYHRNDDGSVFSVGYYGGNAPKGSVDGKFTPITGLDDIEITTEYQPTVWTP